jgi:hypothetical protein
MKYRKLPVVIEATQFDCQSTRWPKGVKPWPDEKGAQPRDMSWGYIDTLEGRMHVYHNDWIITGVNGENYPVKDEIFRMTYEPA